MTSNTCYGCLYQTWKNQTHADGNMTSLVWCLKHSTPKDKRERGWVEYGPRSQILKQKPPTPYDDCWVHP